jgi:hypothetical protein
VGGLSYTKERTGANVLCHRNTAVFIEKGRSEPIDDALPGKNLKKG